MAKFSSIAPLSLLSWCRLSFPIVGLKTFSRLNFTLSLLAEFSYGTYENDSKPTPISHTDCHLDHQFSPNLVHAHSKHLSELYMTSHH